ncbi:MAG: rRNA maturation RNase YbeY [Bacteroidetes bacterium]|nr:rRNA maturation RNase YbeY [Bacteroidota bacterium]
MIEFISEADFEFSQENEISNWIESVIEAEGCFLGEITYVFCDDKYLLSLNEEYLNHDTLTDIISFDYCVGKQVHGEIYISVERVRDNASDFEVPFENELLRVLIHGILHFLGYTDTSENEKLLMREKENTYIALYESNNHLSL